MRDKSNDKEDKIHLKENYKLHENNLYGVIHYLCHAVGGHLKQEINERGVFSIVNQRGEEEYFDILKDYHNQRGEGTLISFIYSDKKTDSRVLFIYSPTKGIAFEYHANLLPKNIQLGKNDFFGKTIEHMITDIASATEGIKFSTNIERFAKIPNGLKEFYIITEDFVEKEKQEDVVSIISTLDGLVQGLQKNMLYLF